MEKEFDSAPASEVTREELTAVMTALEPDQIISPRSIIIARGGSLRGPR